MSDQPTVTTVFEEVEPDPDAVLEAFDADGPDDLVAGGGRHDPVDDEHVAADETLETDLCTGLVEAFSDGTDAAHDGMLGDGESDRGGPDVALSEPTVTVLRGDGADIDDLFGREESTPARPRQEPTLVGPGPSVTRIASDAFSSR